MTATGLDRAEGDGFDHGHAPGRIGLFDESARRLSHEELAVAKLLVAEGHDVRAVAISDRATPDLEVCRRQTEIKTLGREATSATVTNALRRARHQGADVIVDARGSGLQRLAAEQGVAAFATRRDRGLIERIRVMGSGFDRSYRGPDLDRMARRHEGPRLELR